MEFFRKLFTAKKTAPNGRPVRLTLEAFETRDLPNASPLFAAFHSFAGSNQVNVGSVIAGAHQCDGEGQTQLLTAALTGATGTSGSVTFRSNTTTGDNSLNVQVSGLTANATYTVTSGTTTLGTIVTDANGHGSLSVNDLSPALTAGAAISVLDSNNTSVLTGTLAVPTSTTATNLSASLTGATGTSGTARFHADATADNSHLKIQVSGLSADTTYTVQVAGASVGQIVTNANGSGRLSVSDPSTTIAAGSAITVQDSTGTTVLQGTFAATDGWPGGRRHHS